jgi:hypothetical protein
MDPHDSGGDLSDDDDDDGSPASLEEEILRGMYPGEEELAVVHAEDAASTTFRLHLAPSVGGGGGGGGSFVCVVLELTVDRSGYPETPPLIAFSRVVGLSDAQLRALRALLDAECAELAGEYVCASLAAVATDFLSDHNTPPRCAICLDAIAGSAAAANHPPHVMTAGCLHFFHADCLAAWWMRCALAHATGLRGVAVADISRVGAEMEASSCEHAAAVASLDVNEKRARKCGRRLEVMRQQRAALDRPGTLSPKEIEDMAALDVTVRECEEALEVAKRERKADKQRAEKLQWRVGESKARWDKLCAGAATLPAISFPFRCPVCRAPVERSLIDPHLNFGTAGGRWWEEEEVAGAEAGGARGVRGEAKAGRAAVADGGGGGGEEGLGKELLLYIKKTQELHAKLKRAHGSEAGSTTKDGGSTAARRRRAGAGIAGAGNQHNQHGAGDGAIANAVAAKTKKTTTNKNKKKKNKKNQNKKPRGEKG